MPLPLASAVSIYTRNSALVAYVHYLSLILCISAIVFERINLKVSPNRSESISMITADIVYGFAGIALLVSGIFRVIKYGQGAEFYTHNQIFWAKMALFAFVGALSLYPTFTYIRWAIPISKGELPDVSTNLVDRIRLIINIELIGFACIPLLATFMARGIGLNN